MIKHTRQSVIHRAFTLVELLVTIAIIGILVAILFPALGGAFGTADRAKSQTQVNTIVTAFEAFYADFQYDPPLVAPPKDGRSVDPPGIRTPELQASEFADYYSAAAGNTADAYRAARYHSEYTIAAYLLGMGDLNGDGRTVYDDRATGDRVEPNEDDGLDTFGFRNPGEFRAWKKRGSSNNFKHEAPGVGREYGPYIEQGVIKDIVKERKIGGNGRPDESGFITMYVMVDPWGTPYRYYRNWPTRLSERSNVARIPVELRNPDSVARQLEAANIANDDAKIIDLDRDALTARFMVLGAGAKPGDLDTNGNAIAPFGDVLVNRDSGATTTVPVNDPNFNINTIDSEVKRVLRDYVKSNVRGMP